MLAFLEWLTIGGEELHELPQCFPRSAIGRCDLTSEAGTPFLSGLSLAELRFFRLLRESDNQDPRAGHG